MTVLIIRPLAEADVQEASDWYEEREPGLGSQFVDEISDALVRVRRKPLQFPDIGRGMRRALLRRFPYAIYFILRDENKVTVLAVLHQHRNPNVWKKRLQEERKAG